MTHLLQNAVSSGVNLQTFTPVSSVQPIETDAQGFKWAVETARGTVKTKTVIYATNGYTSALVPEMKGKIVPVRGMVARLAGAKAPKLKHSYMMRLSGYEYDYMIPRPDGSIVVGGGRRDFYKNLSEWFDVADDSHEPLCKRSNITSAKRAVTPPRRVGIARQTALANFWLAHNRQRIYDAECQRKLPCWSSSPTRQQCANCPSCTAGGVRRRRAAHVQHPANVTVKCFRRPMAHGWQQRQA